MHAADDLRKDNLEAKAHLLLKAESEAQARVAASMGVTVLDRQTNVRQRGAYWYAESSSHLSSGMELRGFTELRPGKARSIGAESLTEGQPELEKSIQLILSRLSE